MAIREDRYDIAANPIVTGRGQVPFRVNIARPIGLPYWTLHYTIRGAAAFNAAGKTLTIEAGDLLMMRPHVPQYYEATSPIWEVCWAVFEPRSEWLEWLQWPDEGGGHFRIVLPDATARRVIAAKFTRTHRLATTAPRRRDELGMNALESLLLECDTFNTQSSESRIDTRIRIVIQFIRNGLSRPLRMSDLTKASGLSVSQLTRLFHTQLGLTPGQFIERERIHRAKQLLTHTAQTVQAIAWEVGFDNPFYFTLRFKRHTKQSPRAYRRQFCPLPPI